MQFDRQAGYIAAIDIGGTFTDFVLQDVSSGEVRNLKVPSTPTDFSVGFADAFRRMKSENWADVSRITSVFHGTTVATNAVIERRIPKLGLLTTQGMRDVLEIRRHWRGPGDLYNFFLTVPEPLVPRDRRKEIKERMLANGVVEVPLDEDQARAAIEELRELGAEALAVCLLHAYANPAHEQRLRELIEGLWPGVPVSVSHNVCGELREYERTTTTVLNALLLPIMRDYLNRIGDGLKDVGVDASLQIMQSNGGLMTPSVVASRPVTTLLSGPVGGVMGGIHVGGLANESKVITLDMGGTSCDLCLVEDGNPRITTENQVEGNPVRVPMFDIVAIGAGGGSIAWIDGGGSLRVGPHSAGAQPGPACYAKGGQEPTITDAHVVLGRIDPSTALVQLQPELAERAIMKIAAPLGMSVREAALGILQIANAKMVESMKVVSIRKGYDPRDFMLIVGGGAGPLHAVFLAEELQMRGTIVPLSPGTLSAFGLLTSNVKYDIVRSYVRNIRDIDYPTLDTILEELRNAGEAQVGTSRMPLDRVSVTSALDLRYVGQAYEVIVPLSEPRADSKTVEECEAEFHRTHERMFGYAIPEEEVELVNVRVQVVGILPPVTTRELERGGKTPPANALLTHRDVVWADNVSHRTAIFKRKGLLSGNEISGPAVIEQFGTTVVLPPGCVAQVDTYGNLIMRGA